MNGGDRERLGVCETKPALDQVWVTQSVTMVTD